MLFEHAAIGLCSIGPREGFGQTFDVIEREVWDLFGVIKLQSYAEQLTHALIPSPDDHDPWAQSRSPMDMIRHG